MKRILIILLIICSSVGATKSQEKKVKKLVNRIIKNTRKGRSEVMLLTTLYKKSNSKYTLKYTEKYLNDSIVKVRAKAYSLITIAGTNTKKRDIRSKALNHLLKSLGDRDSGNLYELTGFVRQFKKSDFNSKALDVLYDFCRKGTYHYDRLIMIVGFAGNESIMPFLQQKLKSEVNLTAKDKWALNLALARLGDEEAIASVTNVIKSAPVNSDIVYDLVPDILYTRQQRCIEPVIDMLFDDEKRCLSSNPDNPQPIKCGYRIMEYMAPVVTSYPLRVDEDYEILTDDYPGALIHLRKWMLKNRSKLKLNSEIY